MKVHRQQLSMIVSGALRQIRRPDTGTEPTGTHPVHRPGGRTAAKITIVTALLEPLDDVTDAHARQEGFPDAATYRDEWCRLHDRAWTGELAWTVVFEVLPATERQHFLRAARRTGMGVNYDDSPRRRLPKLADPPEVIAHIREAAMLADEPEAIDPAIVADLPASLEARQRHQRIQLQRQRAREDMPLSEIVALELAAAREAGVDTRVYEESILRRLRALRNRTRRAA